jgi:hypothetical protein
MFKKFLAGEYKLKGIGIILVVFFLFIFFFLVLSSPKRYRYKIKQDSNIYHTNSITKDANGCVIFQNGCGCDGRKSNITVCGTYTLVENFGN